MKIRTNPLSITALLFCFVTNVSASFKLSEEIAKEYNQTYSQELQQRICPETLKSKAKSLWYLQHDDWKELHYKDCDKKFPSSLPIHAYLISEFTLFDKKGKIYKHYSQFSEPKNKIINHLKNAYNDTVQLYWLGYISFLEEIEGKIGAFQQFLDESVLKLPTIYNDYRFIQEVNGALNFENRKEFLKTFTYGILCIQHFKT